MLETKTQNWLYRVMNIYPHEFSRVFISWVFRFIYRFALVLAWTFIVAYFVQRFGEHSLPYLFLTHACILIAGSLLFIRLSHKFSLEGLFLSTVILATSLLLLAHLGIHNDFWTLFILFFVEGFILIQLSINFDTFVERIFTPLESARTFPVIESADTLGALVAGTFLFFASDYLSLFTLLWILIGSLSFLIPVLLTYHRFIRLTPGMCMYRKQLMGNLSSHEEPVFQKSYQSVKKHEFTRSLIWIVLLQWAVAVLLEFLFTASVSEKVLSSAAEIPATASGVENILIHEFGFLYIFFGAAAFLSQIFLAPRVIRGLGIIPSMILYPVVYLLSLIGLVGSFGFFTTVLARMNAEITGGIYRNAYQSAYYVFEEEESQHTRLFLEGIIRPVGVLAGTLYLLFGRLFVPEKFFLTSVTFGMFIFVVLFLLIVSQLQGKYIQTTVNQLFSPHTSEDLKLHLLEVLKQKDYDKDRTVFYKLLNDEKTSLFVRMKILELLSDDPEVLPVLFLYLKDANQEIRLLAASILKKFARQEFFSSERLFSRQIALQTLKAQYMGESQDRIRQIILEILALIGGKEVNDFFIDALQNESGQSLSRVIYACRLFKDEGIFFYLKDFLNSQHPDTWASCAIALGKFGNYDKELEQSLWKYLKDERPAHFLAALKVVRFLKNKHFSEHLKSHMHAFEKGTEIYFYTVVTLAELGDSENLKKYVEFLLDEDVVLSEKAYSLLFEFSEKTRRLIEMRVHPVIFQRLHHFLKNHKFQTLQDLPFALMYKLRMMYLLLNSSEDVSHIDSLLHQKDPLYHPSLILPLYV